MLARLVCVLLGRAGQAPSATPTLRLALAPLLALAACGSTPEDSSGGSTTSSTVSSSATSDGGTTTVATTGVSATETTTTAAPTSSATTTSSSTSTSTTTTGAGSTGDTGAVPLECALVDGDHGPCETELGWVWNGVECALLSGCDCAPDCARVFPDAAACALGCAAGGRCNPDRIEAAALAMEPVQEGSFCDGVHVCPGDNAELEHTFEQIFGALTCEPGGFPCEDPPTCAALGHGTLGPDAWLKLCAASLIPMSGSIYCTVYGP